MASEHVMSDLVETIKQVGYRLDIGYWLIDLDNRMLYWPRGLGRPREVEGDRGYVASSLDRSLGHIDEADQGRFRAFLADIAKGNGDYALEVTCNATWGSRIRVRLAGRQTGTGRDTRIVGLVEVIDRWREAERRATKLDFVIEALFAVSDEAIAVFDNRLKVRRLNRIALDLFGLADAEVDLASWSAAVEAKLPDATREVLYDALDKVVDVSGTIDLGGHRLVWRAGPWGRGIGEMSGLVMTIRPKMQTRGLSVPVVMREPPRVAPPPVPPPPAPPPSEGQGHGALEWVKHPIVLASISTGEMAFANRAARERFSLPSDRRIFVENVQDLSGFTCHVDRHAVSSVGGLVVRLRPGARVGRMRGYDDDLLFVEYHDVHMLQVPRMRPRSTTGATLGDGGAAV